MARKRTMPRDDAAILDILKAANLALAFTGKLDKAVFLADLKTQSGNPTPVARAWRSGQAAL